jgi:isopentenyldiphosphate isomerase
MEKLNVVDEEGNVIGEETRENIHKQGLLHKEVHVLFYTPTGELIFQHRAKDKDTYPDLLDVAVGGHVEIGSDYDETALQEMKEETGICIEKKDLTLIKIIKSRNIDTVTNTINNSLRAIYIYRYDGNIKDLRIEKGKSIGFEVWSLEKIQTLSLKDKQRFIVPNIEGEYREIFKQIRKMI